MLKVLGHGTIAVDIQRRTYKTTIPKGIIVVNLKMPGRLLFIHAAVAFFKYLKDNKELFTDGRIEDSITDVLIESDNECFELCISREGQQIQNITHDFEKSTDTSKVDSILGFHYMDNTIEYKKSDGEHDFRINYDDTNATEIEKYIVDSVKIESITSTERLLNGVSNALQKYNYQKPFVLFIFSCQVMKCREAIGMELFSRYSSSLNNIIQNPSEVDKDFLYRNYYPKGYPGNSLDIP